MAPNNKKMSKTMAAAKEAEAAAAEYRDTPEKKRARMVDERARRTGTAVRLLSEAVVQRQVLGAQEVYIIILYSS